MIWNTLAWISALINHRILGGKPGMSVSARCFIEDRTKCEAFINAIMWVFEADHCRRCWDRMIK